MNISNRIRNLSMRERDELACKVGTTPAYLSRIAYGKGKPQPGPKLARKLAKAMNLTLADVRPDLWGDA